MTHSGYIDWHRISKLGVEVRQGTTFVYAYWLVDFDRSTRDHGVTLLKDEDEHPDWFIHADPADSLLYSVLDSNLIASPNAEQVYGVDGSTVYARPLLGSVCLGSASTTYRHRDGLYWWCAVDDLTRQGRRLIKELSMLYLRQPVIVTFMSLDPMGQAGPGRRDPATVTPSGDPHRSAVE